MTAKPELAIEQQVDNLLGQMTLKEKVSLLSGRDSWNTMPIERLDIPALVMTDGPNGVRADKSEFGRPSGATTAFPDGISMGASWDTELVSRAAEAMAEETLAMGCDLLLGPCVNIVRAPLGGRNFETYSEDPYLSGQLAVAYIKGLQSRSVGASLKHFAVNNQEIERFRSSSEVDERTLREIYLPAFETAVIEAQPWTVMCSYNRINGVYASENGYLLNRILRDEWGFEGLVVSDWGANHTTLESIEGGLDLEMPGPAKYYGKLLSEAVYMWQIDEAAVDQAARRVIRMALLSGRGSGQGRPQGSVNTPEHKAVARELAEESITLLKNEGAVLPFDLQKIKTLAVIGPNADELVTGGGGSSRITPAYAVSPLEGLKARLGNQIQIEYAQGCDNTVTPLAVKREWLTLPDGSGPGLLGEYFANTDLSGQPLVTRADHAPDFWWFSSSPAEEIPVERFSARWSGTLKLPASGNYKLQLFHSGTCKVYLGDGLLFEGTADNNDKMENSGAVQTTELELKAGQPYQLRVEWAKFPGQEFASFHLGMQLTPKPGEDHRLEQAVDLARQKDAVIIFAGMPALYESEGTDRPDMLLPNRQDELIQAVAAVNPNTVVVINAGAPVAMPWVDQVAALLVMYYPGQEGGHAIARVLCGDVNPSGRLPVTYPRRLEDNPGYDNTTYPDARQIFYGEGIFVGYRYYDHRQVEPLFPFGAGLSYTTFAYSDLQAPAAVHPGETFQISLRVTNTGPVAGKEVVQLYIADPQSSLPRPPKELKGFAKILLQPGESRVVTFDLGPRSLSFYDPVRAAWVAEPGQFEALPGSSSQDIRLRAVFRLEP